MQNELDIKKGSEEILKKINDQWQYAERYNQGRGSDNYNDSSSTQNKLLYGLLEVGSAWAFIYLMYYMYTYLVDNANSMFGSSKQKFDIMKSGDVNQRLDDVKGIDEIKEEIVNLINMIKDPKKYNDKGAKLHKGVLLFGEPGTGKTLLARAISGEAGCNFIFCSGSQFDEMYVGVGAKRVRELFKKAKENQPCIIFIDEIDSLLTKGRRGGEESSSSRATINQFLAEVDGFEQTENITIIGATNHEQALDPASTRPGRFDKKIHVPHPDVNGREDIFNLYLDKIVRSPDIDAKKLS